MVYSMKKRKILKYINPEDREILRKTSEEIDMSTEEGKKKQKRFQ